MLAVKRIAIDDWKGTNSHDRKWECTRVEDAEDAVRSLNGQNRTMVELRVDDTTYMTIGGGNEGKYVCYIESQTNSMQRFHNLCNCNAKPGKLVAVVAGGQRGEYKPRLCCDLTCVLTAVRYFVMHGLPAPDLEWDVDA